MKKKTNILESKFIFIYLFLYFIVSLIFLTDFPYVHSDEPWLSGLSRQIMNYKDFSVTEPFFDIYLRYPHGIKAIFHLIQILFINVFSYNIFSVRLISLIFSIGSLFVFYRLVNKIFTSNVVSIILTILLSLDIQFVYASHFARQEIIILFFILLSTTLLIKNIDNHTHINDIILGIIIGVSIGIHPNSFIIALTIGTMYLYLIYTGKLKIKNLIILVIVVSLFALIFIGISFCMDSNFIEHYALNGEKYQVNKNIFEKFTKGITFYSNLFHQVSRTYYMPNIRFQLILFTLIYFLNLVLFIKEFLNKKFTYNYLLFIGITGTILGIVYIGRYNVTSILFLFPFGYLLTVLTLKNISSCRLRFNLSLGIFLIVILLNTLINLPIYKNDYSDYLLEFSNVIPKNANVLGNLNSEYYFDNEKLYDYRNLAFLADNNISFPHYIQSRNIRYIVYYDELEYIYEKTPKYNGVYGDVAIYYDELKEYLNENCTEIYSFYNSTYGTNLSSLVDNKDWLIRVYLVTAY